MTQIKQFKLEKRLTVNLDYNGAISVVLGAEIHAQGGLIQTTVTQRGLVQGLQKEGNQVSP